MHASPQHAPDRGPRARSLRSRFAVLGGGALVAALTVATPGASVSHAAAPASGTAAERTTSDRDTTQRTSARRISNRKALRALDIARAQKGDPYRYGATGPNAFDCSGLIRFSFARAGFSGIPRTSSAQAAWARRIPKRAMRPGDLVFFTDGGGVYHAGIFAKWDRGRRVIVHAPSTGSRVHAAKIWTGSWFAGTLRRR